MADGIGAERVDVVSIPVRDKERATAFYSEIPGVEFPGETFDSGVCHMALFKDSEGNGLVLHHRYAPFEDGSQP